MLIKMVHIDKPAEIFCQTGLKRNFSRAPRREGRNDNEGHDRSSTTTFTKWSKLSLCLQQLSQSVNYFHFLFYQRSNHHKEFFSQLFDFLFRTQLTILLSIVCIFLLCSIPRSVILMHEVRYQMDRAKFSLPANQAKGKYMFVFNVCSSILLRCGS